MKFMRYLHGVSDAGTRLLYNIRSGTHDLNEELDRHRLGSVVMYGENPAYKDS